MTEEDEAFEDLAKRQGDWGMQGSRKHQILRYAENVESKGTSMTQDEILQAITDPENQPSQFGTVTLEYHQEKMKQWEDLFDRMSANFERASDKAIAQRIVPLYTISPQRTEPPQKKVWTFWDLSGGDITDAIKAKLKEKNQ